MGSGAVATSGYPVSGGAASGVVAVPEPQNARPMDTSRSAARSRTGHERPTPRGRSRRGAVLAAAGAVAALLVVLTGCSSGQPPTNASRDGAAPAAGSTRAVSAGDPASSPGACTGTIGDRAVDDVRVPAGATCRLVGTTVTGNVSVAPGGTLEARGVAVDGDVEGQGAHQVVISAGSTIGGNLQLEQGGAAAVGRAVVRGDVQWLRQAGPLTIRQAVVGGNLQVDQNRGWLIIARSRVGGDLQCHQNVRTPIQREAAVRGNREGQCAPVVRRAAPVHRTTSRPPVGHRAHAARPRPPCAGDSVSDDPSDDACGDD